MHDIDGTRLETSSFNEAESFEEFGEATGEIGYEGEFGEGEFGEGEMDELSDEGEFGEMDEFGETEAEDAFEAEVDEMAAELLGVSTEEELDRFLGGLFKKIKKGVSGASRFLSRSGFPLSGALKSLAQRALPFVGGALGTAIPIPGLGTIAGSALGKAASSLLQSEMDQFEGEDQEFQMAKRFVRLASQAVRQGARIPPRYHPTTAATLALRNAVRGYRRVGGFRSGLGFRAGYQGYRPGYGQGSWRGHRRYWPRNRSPYGAGYPGYAGAPQCPPCPPPEPCPTCAQPIPVPDQDTGSGAMSGGAEGGTAGGNAPAPTNTGAEGAELNEEIIEEFGLPEQEHDEGEAEGDFYETDYGTPIGGGGRSGRWVRRGRKIVLLGL